VPFLVYAFVCVRVHAVNILMDGQKIEYCIDMYILYRLTNDVV